MKRLKEWIAPACIFIGWVFVASYTLWRLVEMTAARRPLVNA